MEDILRKEKAFIEDVLNSLQDIFFVIDLKGRFLRWNKSLSAITGYSDKEISTKKPTDFFLGKDVQSVSNAIEMVVKNGTASIEVELVIKNGEHINYEFNGTLLKDYDGEPLGICGVGRNITERKRMELEYKTILNSTMDSFYVVDSQGRILDVNDSYCSLIGYSREELLNMGIKDIDAIDSEEMIAERIHRILKVGWERFETRHKCKDGRIVDIESSVNYIEAGGGKFFVFMRDITERKRIEIALKENEARLSEAQSVAHIGNWEWNLKTNELYWSAENYKIFGLAPTISPSFEVFLNTVHPNDLEFVKKSIDEALHGEQYDIDIRIIKPDGKDGYVHTMGIVNFDEEGNPTRMFGTVQDITERKHAEELLKSSKKFAETVINSMNDAIAVIDTNNFRIIEVNSIFLKNYGMKKEDVIGKCCYEITHKRKNPCVPPFDMCPLIDTLKTGLHSNVEHVHYMKDGEKRYIEVSTSPIIDENGKIFTVIHVEHDITKLKLDESKIKTSLDEKEVLLREIHHRVKNNMQIVSSLLMLQSQNIEDKKYKDMFIDSQTRIYSMALIHEKLYQSESIAQINFKEYIDGIISNIFESHGQKSNIKIDIKAENIPIKIDYAVPCGLIINELITNSLKYAFPNDRPGIIKIILISINNNNIQLSISDNGIGIPKEQDIRNTKSLGLHLVTALVEAQLHGKLILNRERGTEFQISFCAK